ncbi:MAG: MerR family transcriptional regulator [Anaerolineae bacterium]|nr:MerR family transcriptional regulator [Anaerolineae bacterium]
MFKIGDFSRLSQVSVKALRYYDQRDLLKPAHTDPFTAYRYYTAEQLPRLNRILALKDLGLSLEQVHAALESSLSPDQLGAMLRQKRAEITRQVAEEQARLARVEARLQQIEREGHAPEYEIVIKPVEAQRVIGIRDTVADYHSVGALFYELEAYIEQHGINSAGCMPCVTVYYDNEYRDTDIDIFCGGPVPREIPDSARVTYVDLPAVTQMACVIYRGPYTGVGQGYDALLRWIEANPFCITGPNRMVYVQGPPLIPDPADYISEIQFPVTPRT